MTHTEELKIELFADIGSGEPFVARIIFGLLEILKSTNFGEREKVDSAIFDITKEGLIPAFINLREIRSFEKGAKRLVRATLDQHYHNLYGHLWIAYKDRLQIATKLLGFDIGFLFKNEEEFIKGCDIFQKKYPEIDPSFIAMLKDERRTWQNILHTIRNDFLNHKKLSKEQIEKFFTLESAELMFQNCWGAIEEILVCLMRTALPRPTIDIAEIPENERDPNLPKRYRFVAKIT